MGKNRQHCVGLHLSDRLSPLGSRDFFSQPCIDNLRGCNSLRFGDLGEFRNNVFVDGDQVLATFDAYFKLSFRQSIPMDAHVVRVEKFD